MKAIYATDLSAASEAAIESDTCLECLQRIGIDEIHLVTVVPPNVHAGLPGLDFSKRRKRELTRLQEELRAHGFVVEGHVVRGTPHRRINGIAESIGAEMAIVGSRGHSPLENRLIGSTARNLARTTVVPLLVTRIERETTSPEILERHLFERILYATDFSKNADRTFRAFEYLQHATEEARLVHVQSPKEPDDIADEPPKERLRELASTLASLDIAADIAVRTGDPATELLEVEAEYDPSATLIGSRGHSRLRRLLLGSVSETVVAKAKGNVLLVPPQRVP